MEAIVVRNKVYRPVFDETLTEEDLAKERLELRATENVKKFALDTLRDMLARDEKLNARMDDAFLLRFLRARKFDCQRSVKLVRDYYTFREKHPYLFPLPSQAKKALEANIYSVLPYRDSEGRAIITGNLEVWDSEDISFMDMKAALQLTIENLLDNPVSQINGFVTIWDCQKLSWNVVKEYLSFSRLKALYSMMVDCQPARQKVTYTVRTTYLIDATQGFMLSLLKKKHRERVKNLGPDINALYEHIDPEILPLELGGVLPPESVKTSIQTIFDKEDYFLHDRQFGYHR